MGVLIKQVEFRENARASPRGEGGVYFVTKMGYIIIIYPILVTFGQICNFWDPNLVTFYFYELTHFLD